MAWLTGQASRRATLLSLGILAVAYLCGVHATWWPTPDSALYLGIGENLLQGNGYIFNGRPSNVASPGLPVLLAGLMKVFGRNFYLLNLVMTCIGFTAVVLIWRCVSRLSDPVTGLLTALMTACSYRFFQSGHEILTDMPFVAGFWLTFYCLLRFGTGHWLWLVGAAMAAMTSCAVRVPGVLAMGSLAVAIALGPELSPSTAKRLLAAGILLLVAGGGWLGYQKLMRAVAPEQPTGYVQHAQAAGGDVGLGKNLAGGAYNFTEVVAESLSAQEFMPLGAAAVGLFLASGLLRIARRRLVLVTSLVYVLALTLATGAWAVRVRYLLPVLGLLFYGILDGLCMLVWWIRRRKVLPWQKPVTVAAVAMTAIVLTCNAPKNLRWSLYYTWLSFRGDYYARIEDGNHSYLPELRRRLPDIIPPGQAARLTGHNPSILHYISGRTILPLIDQTHSPAPSADQIIEAWEQAPQQILIHSADEGSQAYQKTMTEELSQRVEGQRLEPIYQGDIYRIYRRTGPSSSESETSPASSDSDSMPGRDP